GLKQGLMGELTDDYLWFLIPVCSIDDDNYKNCMILEAVPLKKEDAGELKDESYDDNSDNQISDNILTDEDISQNQVPAYEGQSEEEQGEDGFATGMATYLFKIFNEDEVDSAVNNISQKDLKIAEMIRKINKALIAINF